MKSSNWLDISDFDYVNLAYVEVLVRGQDGAAVAYWDAEENQFITDLRGKGNGQTVYDVYVWMPIPD